MNEWWLLSVLVCFTFVVSFLIIFPLRRYVLTSLFLLPTIFFMAFSGYYYWGGFAKWREYVDYQEKKKQAQVMLQSIKGPEELIEKLRVKLDASPKSAKGWYLLGRLYAGQNQQQHAADAFATAHQLNPNEAQYTVHYAHSLWELNHQQFTDQIRAIFRNLLKNNPHQPDALAMLAMDAFLSHNDEDAISYWRRLLKLAAPESDEAQAIRKAIAKAQARSLQDKNRESFP